MEEIDDLRIASHLLELEKKDVRIRELEAAIQEVLNRFTPSYGPTDPVEILKVVLKGGEVPT